ncbi:Trichodiene synthase [Leucoagaricus sp. SymC.cos]|nr:Trichodiene synthase [Leucoagaricus sp. SymC.cos]
MAIEQLSPQPQTLSRKALEDGVRTVVTEFLSKCKHSAHIPYTADAAIFERECCVEAYRRGYDMSYLTKHLHVGILVSNATYFYQSNELKLYIAYYTGLMLCVDDNFDYQADGIIHFMERYQRGEHHPSQVLQNIADLLAETSSFFDPVATNLIMCASFSFMNAMVIEHITAGMKLPSEAKRYPDYLRLFSGLSKAYSTFIFRPSTNPAHYIHAFPELEDIINYVNDITSFYKEELAGEDENTVSLLAKLHNRSKLDQLRVLADKVVESHHNTCAILQDRKDAYNDYMQFWSGYVPFHAASKRYRLSELGIH